jgi:radical SAM protein with 4Fe4S-binding SPASM domain
VDSFLALMGPCAPLRRTLTESGIDVVVPWQSTAPAPAPEPDDRGCIGAGWFGEVTPNGDMVLCSDRYGNPDYFIGNIAQTTMDEIWAGDGRRSALRLAQRTACYQTNCPSNGRGFFFNRLFREIEQFRDRGRLEEVRAWISDLRDVLPVPTHSFFI